MNNKKLYRSKSDMWVGGVCGGLAKYWDTDPMIVRIFGLILVLGTGIGLLAYIVMWIVVPINPAEKNLPGKKTGMITWIIFIIIIVILFLLVKRILNF